MAEETKGPICRDEELGETLKKTSFELIASLERQLKEQGKRGLPVEEGLKNVRKVRRYLKKVLK